MFWTKRKIRKRKKNEKIVSMILGKSQMKETKSQEVSQDQPGGPETAGHAAEVPITAGDTAYTTEVTIVWTR